MDAQRALLDSLLGFNRDGDRPDEEALDFRHPRVCKAYLCGLCPRELFQHTRLDAGACDLLHVPALRAAFQVHRRNAADRNGYTCRRTSGYERALAHELSQMLVDVEKKIARAQKRLDEGGDEGPDKAQILQLTQEVQDVALQAEQATRDGLVDKSLQLMEQAELLKKQRRALLRQSTRGGGLNAVAVDNVNQKLRVCDVCGAFLSIFDSERRLADHFGGKVHVGYVQIRSKLKEMMEAMQAERNDEGTKRRLSVERLGRKERPRRRNDGRSARSQVDDRERRRDRDRSRSPERRRHRDRPSRRKRRSRSQNPERKRSRSHRHRY
ncbi:unnamed protein product [Hyaloperonospora brassicae]|uniref:U1-type domain-containing protein n=1 Tax=Hyaloperonospora brassicae TaxID=162125 RepID=A0AAV0UDY2_HYABA|nr:unnamed protein product [Hyaloperonospora brassicae]